MGHSVVVFDAAPVGGGMMRLGIPAYRLPREVLDREIAFIECSLQVRFNSEDITMKKMSRRTRGLVALTALLLILGPGAAAQRAGGPPNESEQLPTLTAPVRIAPDYTIRAIQTDAPGASYPRVIQLQHFAGERGRFC